MEELSAKYLNRINELLGKDSLTEEDENQIYLYCVAIEVINKLNV